MKDTTITKRMPNVNEGKRVSYLTEKWAFFLFPNNCLYGVDISDEWQIAVCVILTDTHTACSQSNGSNHRFIMVIFHGYMSLNRLYEEIPADKTPDSDALWLHKYTKAAGNLIFGNN